ncbi:hypothetical protein KSS87_001501 [Heliosperma pusillum]|nr:hypothetical protein KSS87_001501 [Heliosperma pusillum]
MSRNGQQDPTHQFRTLVEKAGRKFARVRDLPAYGPGPGTTRYLAKVFKSYMRVWRYQQEHRPQLVGSGLQRWEIGDIASRIAQLYFGQYMRTSEARFLLESFVFYEAVLNRRYFDSPGADLEESKIKEWKIVVQEIVRFVNADKAFPNGRPSRYCAMFDTHPDSLPYVARFHAKKALKLHDAILTSYHRNEIKFAELTLDTFRMLQCLEWEPSGSSYQKRQNEPPTNGDLKEYSATSGMIDLNLAADMSDPTLPPNPKKAVLYRPKSTHLLAVIATVCEELPPEKIMLVYVSSFSGTEVSSVAESSGGSRRFSKNKVSLATSSTQNEFLAHIDNKKGYLSDYYDNSLCLSPHGSRGSNNLYPGDLLPFTRRPLFLIIDSDNSHAFKAERGEPCALLLSPSRPSFKSPRNLDESVHGSQFTLFLTAPLLAFCQMVGVSVSDRDAEVYDEAEYIIANAVAKWEVMLCSSTKVDLVWAQVLADPFLRRIILRFIFCRAALTLFHHVESKEPYLPACLPHLPEFVSPDAEAVESYICRLASHLNVSDCFDSTSY